MLDFLRIDSKFMQTLTMIGDYILLNLLFILCCVPVFTIGAAKTALYRVMFDMLEGRGNTYKRYFKAFFSELKTITPIFLLKLVIIGFLALELLWMTENNVNILAQATLRRPVSLVLLLTMVIVSMVFSSIPAQVSVFNSTRREYLRNGIYIALTKFFRCLLVALLDLLPVLFFLWNPIWTAMLSPLWLFLYFSVAVNLSVRLWKKPFDEYVSRAQDQE